MDTKLQALEKAQKKQREIISKGWSAGIGHCTTGKYFSICGENFEYSEPKPLEKDTLAQVQWPMLPNVYLWSTGGLNEWYPPGCNSKNWNMLCGKKIICDVFEIIETPGDLERMPTPNIVCIQYRCDYFDIHNARCLRDEKHQCTILIGNPSKLNIAKNCKP